MQIEHGYFNLFAESTFPVDFTASKSRRFSNLKSYILKTGIRRPLRLSPTLCYGFNKDSIIYANKVMILPLACASDPILLQHIHNDSHDLQRTKYIEEFDHSIFSVQTLSLFSFLLYSEMQTFFVLANQTDSNIPMQQGMVRYSLWKWSLILFGLYLSFTYILVHLKYKASDGGNTTSVGT